MRTRSVFVGTRLLWPWPDHWHDAALFFRPAEIDMAVVGLNHHVQRKSAHVRGANHDQPIFSVGGDQRNFISAENRLNYSGICVGANLPAYKRLE